MIENSRPSPVRRLRFAIPGTLLLLVGVALLGIESRIARRWEQLERRLDALDREASALPPSPPLLRGGEGTPVIGGERYRKAIAGARRRFENRRLRPQPLDPEEPLFFPEAIWEEAPDAVLILQDLQEGARAADRTIGLGPLDFEGLFHLKDLLFLKVRWLRQERRFEAAEDLELDYLQLHWDLLRQGSVDWGLAELHGTLGNLERRLAGPLALSGGITRLWDQVLERLDGQWSSCMPGHAGRIVSLGRTLVREETQGPFDRSRATPRERHQRRWLWSSRIRVVESVEAAEGWSRQLAAAKAQGWAALRPAMVEVDDQLKAWPDPILSYLWWPSNLLLKEMFARTKLRLLRAGLHYRLTGELPLIEDPFGGVLRTELRGSRLRIWSVGYDGVDQGGEEPRNRLLEVDR